jgi:hypothetical protein
MATFIFTSALSVNALGETTFGASNTVSPPQTQPSGSKPQTPNCTQPNTDPRCRPAQSPYYDSHPHHTRPVIINQLPAEPAIEINSLTDDWEGCRKAKLGSMRARNTGDSDQANHLDEWLWKNCRSYSNELRQLEQNDM